MPNSRRRFIKAGVAAASAGLLLLGPGGAMSAQRGKRRAKRLQGNQDVRVLFSGLLVYRFSGTSYCLVDLLKTQDHLFSVIVKAKEGDNPPYSLWRYCGDPFQDRLNLSVPGTPPLVSKWEGASTEFKRDLNTNDPNDWRWTLRIDEFLFGDAKPTLQGLGLGMRVENGLFYSALNTDKSRTTISYDCKGNGNPEPTDHSVGSLAGANIYLAKGQTAILKGAGVEVPMPQVDGVTYEIYFEYSPATLVKPKPGDQTKSHFYMYYGAMDPKPSKKCDIYYTILKKKGVRPPEGPVPYTPDVPCMGLECNGC